MRATSIVSGRWPRSGAARSISGNDRGPTIMSPLCYARGQWLRLSKAEMADLDVDPDEGRDDDAPPCPTCGNLPCACGDEEEE